MDIYRENIKTHAIGALLLALCIGVCSMGAVNAANRMNKFPLKKLTQYVDPYIGTGGHGHVFVGANVPFGMVQVGPTQLTHGWDWCSGYHYSDSTIIGFGQMHLSGTGIGDLGDISLMPAIGKVKMAKGTLPDPTTGIYSFFSHKNEVVKPGYYKVILNRFGIKIELTATSRVGFHKYTFPQSKESKVIIDLEHGIGWDMAVESCVKQESSTIVTGYRKSTGWAKNQQIYFVAVFSKPMKGFVVSDSITPKEGTSITARNAYGQALFETAKDETVYVKVALSPVSIENAKLNLQTELPGWNFEKTVATATQEWDKQLNKIVIKTENVTDKKTFYTSFYHTLIAPSVYGDVNGDYRGADAKVYHDKSFTNYTTFSLWDTYRAAQPLMTLIHPKMTEDVAQTMLHIYQQQGKLPVWHLMGNETDCMVGNPSMPVLADIILKGYKVDKAVAFEAMKASSMLDDRGMNWLKQYGYIPYDKEVTHESVAKGLEFALADWSVAQVAKLLGKTTDYNYFINRSKSYHYYFDKTKQFVRGLSSEGKFREPFNPFHAEHQGDDYTEGNAWQYTWLVPHDVPGLIALFGGEKPFITKLDSLFIVQGDMGDKASPDIAGLIGQYAHGNEPSHHILYLYSYVGQQWKTAEKVRRQVLTTLYRNAPDGLCGNEDVGQMSAWYVLSALGFYQVAPAGGVYLFGSPLVNEATLTVKNGKHFKIIAHHNSKENMYIQRATLNGKAYTQSYIRFADMVAGGVLEFEMGNTPSTTFGVAKSDRP